MLKRFQQEAGVAARFTNTGVASVYDFGEEHGHFYLVMELVQGSTLDELMDECGPLELSVAASIIVPICAVLAAAHRAGIVHRDLKPSNVMVSEQGHTKVLDFGIARVEGTAVDTRLTRTGRNPGSPGYMAPEQYEGKQVTGRSDLYALGCLLYEMLAGRPVFPQDDEFALLHMHTTVPPTRWAGCARGCQKRYWTSSTGCSPRTRRTAPPARTRSTRSSVCTCPPTVTTHRTTTSSLTLPVPSVCRSHPRTCR